MYGEASLFRDYALTDAELRSEAGASAPARSTSTTSKGTSCSRGSWTATTSPPSAPP